MKLKKTKKSFQWLIKHSITVFSCVLIIALGIVLISYAATTIGTNIDTGGDLTVSGNTTLSGDLDLNLNELKDAVLEKLASFPSSPTQGQMFYSTASSTPYWYTGSQWKGDVSGATFVVAASDSLNKEKADYICDGTADDVQIQAAIDALPSGGGKVLLMEGTYTVSATITTSASSTLQGVGWGTVLDVSGISGSNNAITMSDNTILSDLKVQGTISPLTLNWHNVVAGNHSTIEKLWIDNNTGGLKVSKNNVHVNDCKFTNLRDSSGWVAAISASGSATNGVFIDGIYISDCDRGIEIEDGVKNVFAQHGYLYNVWSAESPNTFTLDAHSHEDGGGVDNIVYKDFYLENSGGITVERSTGSNESDIPRNITFENISINNPWNSENRAVKINGRNIMLNNIKIYNVLYTDGVIMEIQSLSNGINLLNIKILTDTNNGGINIVDGASNVKIENGSFEIGDSGTIFPKGDNITIINNTFKNIIGYAAIYANATSNNLLIANNTFIFDASDPGNRAIKCYGENCNFINNTIIGDSSDSYVIDHYNTNKGIIAQNYVEYDNIWLETDSQNINVFGNNLLSGLILDEGTNNKIYNNRGYLTATSSTATITSGNTYVDITHLLDITPATSTVSIIPLEDLGNASTTNFWISDVGASTFRINVGTDPGKDVDFSWNIGSY